MSALHEEVRLRLLRARLRQMTELSADLRPPADDLGARQGDGGEVLHEEVPVPAQGARP